MFILTVKTTPGHYPFYSVLHVHNYIPCNVTTSFVLNKKPGSTKHYQYLPNILRYLIHREDRAALKRRPKGKDKDKTMKKQDLLTD